MLGGSWSSAGSSGRFLAAVVSSSITVTAGACSLDAGPLGAYRMTASPSGFSHQKGPPAYTESWSLAGSLAACSGVTELPMVLVYVGSMMRRTG